jgi:hypothetical protein
LLRTKIDVFPWRAEVAPFITGGGLEGKYLLYTTHLHWGAGASLLGIEYWEGFLGLNDGSEHQIETTSYGGEVQFYHYKEEYGDPQEASKHKVVETTATL